MSSVALWWSALIAGTLLLPAAADTADAQEAGVAVAHSTGQ